MIRMVARVKAVSEMYGVDTNRDGAFDVLFPPVQPRPGIKVAADDGNGERRCAFVFDLQGIAVPNVSWRLPTLLHLYPSDSTADPDYVPGGSYELHGFSGGPSVTLDDLAVSNLLAGPTASPSWFHPVDVGTFVRAQLSRGARYVGFSVRNVGAEGSVTFSTGSTILTVYFDVPWELSFADIPRLIVELRPPDPWGIPLSDVPRLAVELKPPDPWALPFPDVPRLVVELYGSSKPWELPPSDIPRLVAETPSRQNGERAESTPRAPDLTTKQILAAAMISQIASAMPDERARAIQKQALELISTVAADAIARLDRG